MPSESSFLVSPVEPVTRSPPQSPTSAVTEADLVAATEKGVTLKKCVEVDCRRRHAARQTPSESEACDTESASTATASSSDGYSSESKGGMEMPTSRAEGAKTTNGAASDLTNATAAPTSSDSATTFSVLPSWETLDRDLFAVFLFPFVALGFVLMALQEELFRAVRGSLGWTAAAAAPR